MGIDICLVGYDHESHANNMTSEDLIAGRWDDSEHGYLRSAYNASSPFYVCGELYGFDVAGYLFPGDWDKPVSVDSATFSRKVRNLDAIAEQAIRTETPWPWIGLFAEVTGEPAPVSAGAHGTNNKTVTDGFMSLLTAAAGTISDSDVNQPKRGQPLAYLAVALDRFHKFAGAIQKQEEQGIEPFVEIG